MTTQAMKNIEIDQADIDFIWFKHKGVLYELKGIEQDFLSYIDNFEEDWSRQDVLDMYMMEDLAIPFIEDTFKTVSELKNKSIILV